MRRVRLSLLPGLEIEFTDRDVALRQVEIGLGRVRGGRS
jgi:hypothetical protein